MSNREYINSLDNAGLLRFVFSHVSYSCDGCPAEPMCLREDSCKIGFEKWLDAIQGDDQYGGSLEMSNKEAVDVIKNMIEDKNLTDSVYYSEALEKAIDALENTDWIYIEDRLPEKPGQYICTVKFQMPNWDTPVCFVEPKHFDFENKHWIEDNDEKVVAWIENPEPCKTRGRCFLPIAKARGFRTDNFDDVL